MASSLFHRLPLNRDSPPAMAAAAASAFTKSADSTPGTVTTAAKTASALSGVTLIVAMPPSFWTPTTAPNGQRTSWMRSITSTAGYSANSPVPFLQTSTTDKFCSFRHTPLPSTFADLSRTYHSPTSNKQFLEVVSVCQTKLYYLAGDRLRCKAVGLRGAELGTRPAASGGGRLSAREYLFDVGGNKRTGQPRSSLRSSPDRRHRHRLPTHSADKELAWLPHPSWAEANHHAAVKASPVQVRVTANGCRRRSKMTIALTTIDVSAGQRSRRMNASSLFSQDLSGGAASAQMLTIGYAMPPYR